MSEVPDGAEGLNEAANDAVLNAPQLPVVRCKALDVRPIITIATPKIVVVKKAWQPRGDRLVVRLGTDSAFTGTGTMTCAPGGQIKVFNSNNVELLPPWDFTGANLTKGVKLYVEGVSPSAKVDGTVLSLNLVGGNKRIWSNPATDAMTCVEVTLDLCHYKPIPTPNADTAPLSVPDKTGTGVGRNLHLQTPDYWAGRALLIVRQAVPEDYPGPLVLKARNSRVKLFAYADEVAAANQAVQATPQRKLNNALINNGGKFWVEGASTSGAMLDTGFSLEIAARPGVEGDKVCLTVVKAVIDIYGIPKQPGGNQSIISRGSRMNPGRSLHLQDGGNHYGRAKVRIKKVEPVTWTGNLEVHVWDVTANSANNPRVSLFVAQLPGGPAHANPIVCPAGIPSDGKEVWAQGAIVSGAMRDTQLRLRVTDAEGSADRVAITVHQFYVQEITFNGIRDIYYARIPTAGSFIHLPAADAPADHLTPMQVRPAANTPHWRRVAGQNTAPQFSWPAVYVRRGGSSAGNPTIKVKFELFPKPGDNITVKLKGTDIASTMTTDEKDVTFNNGDSQDITFAIKQMPNVVRRMDGMQFRWFFDGWGPTTQHTLFMTDKRPRNADDIQGNEYIWEIFEWSCNWADGVSTKANVFAAIWGQFTGMTVSANTNLVYWRNWQIGIQPAQDIPTAVQSQDDGNPVQQRAASCIVFDRVLINCCSAHGIRATEIKLWPQTAAFPYLGAAHTIDSWNDTTVNGQGNAAAPPSWESHWIASVKLGNWAFYDASYGEGPHNSPRPGAANAMINVFNFEPHTVQDYNGLNTVTNVAINVPRSAVQAVPPHLLGGILWANA
jgi:hypothetical protein